MMRLCAGAIAGLVATVPMSALLLVGHRLLPRREQYALPPEQIAARVGAIAHPAIARDRDIRQTATATLHFGFGGVTGAAYGLVARRLPGPPALKGIGFGLLVWTVSYLGWLPALGILPPASEHPPRRTALMVAGHVVWGAVLGLLTAALADDDDWSDWEPADTSDVGRTAA